MKGINALKIVCCLAIMLFTGFKGQAQQNPQYSMSMFNRHIYNPAFAGEERMTQFEVGGRKQWLNIDGAPQTLAASFEAPIGRSFDWEQVGLGLLVINDQIGVYNNTQATLQLSKGWVIGNNILSIGAQGSISRESANFSNTNAAQSGDPLLGETESNFGGNIGLGIKLSGSNYYVGFSANDVVTDEPIGIQIDRVQHYFGQAGLHLNRTGRFSYHPNIVVKYAGAIDFKSTPSYEGGAYVTYENMLSLGAQYRFQESIAAIFKLRATQRLAIGYSYDFGTNELSNASAGSHEVWLSFNLGKASPKAIVSPRMFNVY